MGHEVDLDRVAALQREEDQRFAVTHPRSLELQERARRSMPLGVPMSWMAYLFDHPPPYVDTADGAHFTDVDGHRYLDMMLGITAASAGHNPEPVVRAVTDRIARGIQLMLPTEDAIVASEELARRWGLPKKPRRISLRPDTTAQQPGSSRVRPPTRPPSTARVHGQPRDLGVRLVGRPSHLGAEHA